MLAFSAQETMYVQSSLPAHIARGSGACKKLAWLSGLLFVAELLEASQTELWTRPKAVCNRTDSFAKVCSYMMPSSHSRQADRWVMPIVIWYPLSAFLVANAAR